ncbi:MAG: GNAT family N-acetyltransferase [FCB group bacterium]|nr:GNAT family N-acetyltransferase [FCB group bacterium]
MSKIVIAKARRIHVPAVVELWKDFMDFHARLDPLFIRSKRGHLKFKQLILKTIGSRKWQLFVALDEKTVIGYSMCKISDPPPVLASSRYGMLLDAYIEPAYQRQGAGTLLFNAMRDWCNSKGITRLELNVATTNKIACAIWKNKGFTEYLRIMSRPI